MRQLPLPPLLHCASLAACGRHAALLLLLPHLHPQLLLLVLLLLPPLLW
jgi:hypothetical protein